MSEWVSQWVSDKASYIEASLLKRSSGPRNVQSLLIACKHIRIEKNLVSFFVYIWKKRSKNVWEKKGNESEGEREGNLIYIRKRGKV